MFEAALEAQNPDHSSTGFWAAPELMLTTILSDFSEHIYPKAIKGLRKYQKVLLSAKRLFFFNPRYALGFTMGLKRKENHTTWRIKSITDMVKSKTVNN
jgi:hypothetical protein